MTEGSAAPKGAKGVGKGVAIALLIVGLVVGLGVGYIIAPQPAPAPGNVITLEGTTIHLSVLSGPGSALTFVIGGFENPTIEVPAGANVTVHYSNIGSIAHSWVLVAGAPPYEAEPPELAIPGAASPMPHMGQASGENATFAFTATPAGTYWYVCHIPGHAAGGMYGKFVIK